MFSLKTIINDEAILRTKCKEVEKINQDIIDKLDGMLNVMYKYNGIGLAANQAGLTERLVVVDLQQYNRKNPIFMINPEIIKHSDEIEDSEEASLSIPNNKSIVKRYKDITVKYLDKKGKENILEAKGLLSQCIQHEIDGLNGILYIDYLNDDDKNRILSNYKKQEMNIKYITRDDKILRTKCEPVSEINAEIIGTLDKMLNFMYENHGIGLAANQVGILKRMIVIDLQENDIKKPYFLINPEIIEHSKETVIGEEGCLSVPDQRYKVERYAKVKVKYLDKDGKENIIDADGLFAVCLQHEIDHLDGKLYIDYLSKLKQDLIMERVKKLLKRL